MAMRRIVDSRTKQVPKTGVVHEKKGFRTPPEVIKAHRFFLRTRTLHEIDTAAESIADDRRPLFKELYSAFKDTQTLENYLKLQSEFPDFAMSVPRLFGADPRYFLEPELIKHGINPEFLGTFLDDPDASVEELSCRLIELLVDKRKLPNGEAGYINRRHKAVNDGLVDCLILIMLEAIDTHEYCIPAPLMMLLRDRLCGPDPDLRQAYLSYPARSLAIRVLSLEKDKISVRELAAITGVSKNTANRWLHDEDFKREVEKERRENAAEDERSKSFVQSMQVRFNEACDMDALAAAWSKHVGFIEPLLPFWAQDECLRMFKHRQQEIANEEMPTRAFSG